MTSDTKAYVRAGAEDAQKAQARHAKAQLYQFGTAVTYPWPVMTQTLGAIQQGTVHFFCAPSGNGKSTLAGSLVLEWLQANVTVVAGFFERDASSMRRYLAAMSLGLNPGDVLGGEYEGQDDFRQQLDALDARLDDMAQGMAPWDQLHLIEHDHVSPRAIARIGDIAQASDGHNVVCLVDHIDHLGPEGAQSYGASVHATHAIHAHAKKHGTRWLAFSQMNERESSRADKFWKYRALNSALVKNGQHKLEVATTMTGLYRPLTPDVTPDDLKAVADDRKPLSDILWRGVSALNVMKHRDHGERVGQRILLGWDAGRIVDAPSSVKLAVEQKAHGIRTSTGFDR